jgi:hypothetical protein
MPAANTTNVGFMRAFLKYGASIATFDEYSPNTLLKSDV